MSKQVYSMRQNMRVFTYKDHLIFKHYQGKYLQKGLQAEHTQD